MLTQILYKEWIKLRKTTLFLSIVALLIEAYIYFILNKNVHAYGPFETWYISLYWRFSFYDVLKFTPLLFGLITGFAQFIPEKINNRIKLTLHVPLSSRRIITHLLTGGLVQLSIIYILMIILFHIICLNVFDPLATNIFFTHTISWFLAGYSIYFCIAGIIIEPNWIKKIPMLLIAFIFTLILIPDHYVGAKSEFTWFYLILTATTAVLPYHSIYRYKGGHK